MSPAAGAIQEAAEALQTTAHYVPSPLDPTIQAAQLGSAVAVFSLLFVWWGVVVPSARKKLSKDKRKGACSPHWDPFVSVWTPSTAETRSEGKPRVLPKPQYRLVRALCRSVEGIFGSSRR